MPANMISEPAGSSLKVIGSSSATVSAGPMPGSTPTAVPSMTPTKAKSRLIGWRATKRPWPRAANVSIGAAPSDQPLERAGRQRELEPLGEDHVDDEAH